MCHRFDLTCWCLVSSYGIICAFTKVTLETVETSFLHDDENLDKTQYSSTHIQLQKFECNDHHYYKFFIHGK